MSLYLGNTPIAVNSSSRNIGEIIQSTVPLTDAGLHLLDGSVISGSGAYSVFVTHIAGLVSNYPDLFETEANWQTSVTNYGVCGKFVYDSINNTVRLPKYSDKIYTGGGTASVKGNGMTLGLTSGNTNFGLDKKGNSSANQYLGANTTSYGQNINYSESVSWNTSTTTGISMGVTTDSSKSGIIADLSNITTALDGYWYIVIATSTKTSIEVDIDEIATDLNGKADTDLSNVNSNGTSLASGWSMPSDKYINLTLGASGATYTAPANGYFYFGREATAANQLIDMHNQTSKYRLQTTATARGIYCLQTIPARKGDVVQINYSVAGTIEGFRFIYAEGEN